MILDLIRSLHLNPARILSQGLTPGHLTAKALKIGAYTGGNVYSFMYGDFYLVEIDQCRTRRLREGPPLVVLPRGPRDNEPPADIAARALQRLAELRQAA